MFGDWCFKKRTLTVREGLVVSPDCASNASTTDTCLPLLCCHADMPYYLARCSRMTNENQRTGVEGTVGRRSDDAAGAGREQRGSRGGARGRCRGG